MEENNDSTDDARLLNELGSYDILDYWEADIAEEPSNMVVDGASADRSSPIQGKRGHEALAEQDNPNKRIKLSWSCKDNLTEDQMNFTAELQETGEQHLQVDNDVSRWIVRYIQLACQEPHLAIFTWIVETFGETSPGKITELKKKASVLGLTDLVTYLNYLPDLPVSTEKMKITVEEAGRIHSALANSEGFIRSLKKKQKKGKGGKQSKKLAKMGDPQSALSKIEKLMVGQSDDKRVRIALVGKMQTCKSRIAQHICGLEGLSGDTNFASGTTKVPLMIVPSTEDEYYFVDFYLSDERALEKRMSLTSVSKWQEMKNGLQNENLEEDHETFKIPTLKRSSKRSNKNAANISELPKYRELFLCRVFHIPAPKEAKCITFEVIDFPGYNDTTEAALCKAYTETLLNLPNFVNTIALCIQNRGSIEDDDVKFLLDMKVFEKENPHVVLVYWKSTEIVVRSKEHDMRRRFRNQISALFGVKSTQGVIEDAATTQQIAYLGDEAVNKYRMHKWLSYACQSIVWEGVSTIARLEHLVQTAQSFELQKECSRCFESLRLKYYEINRSYRNGLTGCGMFKEARLSIDKKLKKLKFTQKVREWRDQVLRVIDDPEAQLNALPGLLEQLVDLCETAYRQVKQDLSSTEKKIIAMYERRIPEIRALSDTLDTLERRQIKAQLSAVANDLLESNGMELLRDQAKDGLLEPSKLLKSVRQRQHSSLLRRINKLIRGGKTAADYANAMVQISWSSPYPEVNRETKPKYRLVSDLFAQGSVDMSQIKSRYDLKTTHYELKSTNIKPVMVYEDSESIFLRTYWDQPAKSLTMRLSYAFQKRIRELHNDAIGNNYDDRNGRKALCIYPIFVPTVASRDSQLLQDALLPTEVDAIVIAVIDPKDEEHFKQKFTQSFSENNRLVFLVAPTDGMGLGRIRSLMVLLAYGMSINYFWMIDDDVDTQNIQEWDVINETVAKSSLSRALCYTQNLMRWEVASEEEIKLEPVNPDDLRTMKSDQLTELARQWNIVGLWDLNNESKRNAIINKSRVLQETRSPLSRVEFVAKLARRSFSNKLCDVWKKYPPLNYNYEEEADNWSNAQVQAILAKDPSPIILALPKESDIAPEDTISLETVRSVKQGLSGSFYTAAQVALWNRNSYSQKCRYQDLIKTDTSHYLANVRRQVVCFNAAAMNNLLYVNDEEFFLDPPPNWQQLKEAAEKDKDQKGSEESKKAMRLGYHFDDFYLAEQLFYYGKNGFQEIRFSFVGKGWESTFASKEDKFDMKILIDEADLLPKVKLWDDALVKFNCNTEALKDKLATYSKTIEEVNLWRAFADHILLSDDDLLDIFKKFKRAKKDFGENPAVLPKALAIKKGTSSRVSDLQYLVSAINSRKKDDKKAVCVLWLDGDKLTMSIVGVRKYVTLNSLVLVHDGKKFFRISDTPSDVSQVQQNASASI